jgi:ankyrin repeat protein
VKTSLFPISLCLTSRFLYDKKQHIVKYLVKYGADVNATDNGQTCLSVAKEYGEKEIEDYLISVGAHY